METLAVKLLIFLSVMLGVHPIPKDRSNWNVVQEWTQTNGKYTFSAENYSLAEDCKNNLNGVVQFPLIIHGSHRVWGDGHILLEFGSEDFSSSESFYFSPQISCRKLANFKKIQWSAFGYSSYFSRFSEFPKIVNQSNFHIFKSVSTNIISAGALIMLALFSAVVFFNKVSKSLALNIIGSCLFFSIYFISVTSPYFGFDKSMLFVHKIADFGLWFGSFFFFKGLYETGVIKRMAFLVYLGSLIFACFFIFIGKTGDTVQLGTTIPFPLAMVILLHGLAMQLRDILKSFNIRKLFNFLSMFSFALAAHYDIFVITGMIQGTPVFSIGVLFAIFIFTLAVNDEISQTYNERDNLLQSLEEKVEEKTQGLRLALIEKEKAQAELIQNAKLVSLGTLSAGIAHEINNSINYVNGAITPLERLITKVQVEDKQRETIVKLLKSIKDGSQMTVDIVRSLRNFTGLNQAQFNDVNLKEASQSVLTILKNKLSTDYTIVNNISDHISIYGDKVGINQVFMNLISNAIDSMPEGGTITFDAKVNSETVEFYIQDTGSGMSETTAQRIFDPFYTTKDVGKGTGLGLHIVKKEIDKHHGTIQVESKKGIGTKFTITFPTNTKEFIEKEAS